ncbi:MAG: glycosyltransferase [Verrucomicrobiaceae bacterium]|nr:MAG: glycosyltransferase [Verrucomicrobiaceae bacterium]
MTTVVNSTDTRLLIERRDKITPEESSALKRGLGIDSDNIAVFTGGLHHHKRVGYLLESALTIRQSVPDFHLLIIGDGQERDLVTDAAASYPWIHHLGKMDDAAMVPYWCISKLLLMPGLVGLAVIDSFALGVPMVTTEYPFHSPEIEYLKDGVNGVIHRAPGTPQSYADEVIRLLKNPDLISRLRQGALESATHYSVENMVRNMTDGILASLSGDD